MDSNSVKNAVIQQVRTEASVANAQKLMNVCSIRHPFSFSARTQRFRDRPGLKPTEI